VAAQDVDVALAAALRDQPAAGAQRGVQAGEQPLVVADPVKGGGREDRVHRPLELEREQVADAQVGPGAQARAGGLDHRGGLVEADRVPARQALDQRLGDAPGAAAGVQHELVAAQLEPVEHVQAERLHGRGDAVVAGAVPLTR
jgi:hypothetical protein